MQLQNPLLNLFLALQSHPFLSLHCKNPELSKNNQDIQFFRLSLVQSQFYLLSLPLCLYIYSPRPCKLSTLSKHSLQLFDPLSPLKTHQEFESWAIKHLLLKENFQLYHEFLEDYKEFQEYQKTYLPFQLWRSYKNYCWGTHIGSPFLSRQE